MLSSPTVLLVDNDSTTNYLNQRLVSRLPRPLAVLVATNGHEALTLLRTRCQQAADAPAPTLVVLDMNMPVMSGLEFLEAFVRLPLPAAQRQAITIVLLTTTLLESDLARLRQLPVAEVLHKPLTQETLHRVLGTYCNQPGTAG